MDFENHQVLEPNSQAIKLSRNNHHFEGPWKTIILIQCCVWLYLTLLFLRIPAHLSRSVWFNLLWPLPTTLSAPSLVPPTAQRLPIHRSLPFSLLFIPLKTLIFLSLSLSGVFTPQNLKPGWIQPSSFLTSVNSLKSWPWSLAWHSTGTTISLGKFIFLFSEMTLHTFFLHPVPSPPWTWLHLLWLTPHWENQKPSESPAPSNRSTNLPALFP